MQFQAAELARFYSWSPNEVKQLPFREFRQFHNCIKAIEAKEHLWLTKIALQPYQKDKKATDKFQKKLAGLYKGAIKSKNSGIQSLKDVRDTLSRKLGKDWQRQKTNT